MGRMGLQLMNLRQIQILVQRLPALPIPEKEPLLSAQIKGTGALAKFQIGGDLCRQFWEAFKRLAMIFAVVKQTRRSKINLIWILRIKDPITGRFWYSEKVPIPDFPGLAPILAAPGSFSQNEKIKCLWLSGI